MTFERVTGEDIKKSLRVRSRIRGCAEHSECPAPSFPPEQWRAPAGGSIEGRTLQKIRLFLDKPADLVLLFFRMAWVRTRLAFLVSAARRGFGGNGRKATRKWRRKPLESLKMDSAMAIRQFAARAGRIDQPNSL
jgi:hypothetical protein